MFREKHASLLPFDLSMRRHSVVKVNLRRLYGLAQIPCDTALLRRPSGSDLAGAVSAGALTGSATHPAGTSIPFETKGRKDSNLLFRKMETSINLQVCSYLK